MEVVVSMGAAGASAAASNGGARCSGAGEFASSCGAGAGVISSIKAACGAGAIDSMAAWGPRVGTCSYVHKQSEVLGVEPHFGG